MTETTDRLCAKIDRMSERIERLDMAIRGDGSTRNVGLNGRLRELEKKASVAEKLVLGLAITVIGLAATAVWGLIRGGVA